MFLPYALQDTIKYSLTGDEAAMDYFYINPSSGEISLKQLLSQSEAGIFNVSANNAIILRAISVIYCFKVVILILKCNPMEITKKHFDCIATK